MSTLLRACIVMMFLLIASLGACGQSVGASARLTGQVSAAVAVSTSEARALSDRTQVSTAGIDATTIAVSISGSGDGEARVNIPIRVRSNAAYSLRASFLAPSELSVRLSVAEVRTTGKLVHANALEGVSLGESLADPRSERPPFLTVRDTPPQLTLLSGPPVSKAGTLNSPDNALEVVLSIEIRPRAAAKSWSTRLTISAAPDQAGR